MPKISANFTGWLPTTALGFIAGVVVTGFITGAFTGANADKINQSRQQGFTAGYTAAQDENPAIETQQADIRILSNALFMNTLEVELKAVARLTNAIDFTYGEQGRERQRMAALDPGAAIAHQIGNTLYVIKNVAVAANLQRATVEVIRVRLPVAR